MHIPKPLTQQILTYCQTAAPNEACGFVILGRDKNQMQFLPCENQAVNSREFFEISPDDFLRAEALGEILGVVHSHPNGEPTLSLADRQIMSQGDYDWLLICDEQLHFFPKIPPLVGRDFEHSKLDCYTLFRDFYFLSGADLPDFERAEDWWLNGENLYLENMATHGFKRLNSDAILQVGDVILMQVGAEVANHAGIYLGDQMVLHHSPHRLSKRDLYDGYWLKHTHSIWRYEEWSKLDFTVALNSLARSFS